MNKRALLIFAPILCGTMLFAQEVEEEGKVPGGEHYVHGVFNPTIKDAFKILDKPIQFDTIIDIKPMSYELLTVKGATELRMDTIEAARLRMQANLKKLYKGYAKAGIGLYTTPLFEVYYNEGRSRNSSYGVKLKHFSSNGGLNDVGPSAYSDNHASIWGKKFFKEHALDGSIFYDRNVVHFYGFDEDEIPDSTVIHKDDVKQRFNYIGAQGGWKSYFKDSARVNHSINLRYYNLQDKYDAQENNVLFNARFSRYLNSELYALDFDADINGYKRVKRDGHDHSYTNTILRFLPHVSTQGKNFNVLVGLGIFVDATNTAKFHFYPHAEFRYSLFDDLIIPYAGITGSKDRNGLKTLSDENPFIVSDLNLVNTNKKYDIYGGVRGTISSKSEFNAFVSYKKFKDHVFFIMDTLSLLNNQFDVVYDELEQFTIGGELAYNDGEKLSLFTKAEVFSYSTKDLTEAWNLPSFKWTVGGTYDMQNKLLIKLEVYMLGKRKAESVIPEDGDDLTQTSFTRTLNPYFDMYLGLEYRYTKRLSVFLDISNLTATRYARWYRYPTQRVLLMGGATYSF